MALFQNKPYAEELNLPYTLVLGGGGATLVVGLGNPGEKYNGTRHNIGFEVIGQIAKQEEFPNFKLQKNFNCEISEKSINGKKVILAKPQTYMNESGQAVRSIIDFYKINNSNIAVIHDELSINFGQIRSRSGGRAAGHNGIKSVISHIGEDFGRIRVGINNDKKPSGDTSKFVLSKFNSDELKNIDSLVKEASIAANEFIFSGQLPSDTRSIILK